MNVSTQPPPLPPDQLDTLIAYAADAYTHHGPGVVMSYGATDPDGGWCVYYPDWSLDMMVAHGVLDRSFRATLADYLPQIRSLAVRVVVIVVVQTDHATLVVSVIDPTVGPFDKDISRCYAMYRV